MSEKFWVDQVLERLSRDMEKAIVHMRMVVRPPQKRRPPMRTLVEQAVREPATIDYTGRKYLLGRLREKYGDMAEFIAPYIVPDLGTEEG